MRRVDSLEKTLRLGGIGGQEDTYKVDVRGRRVLLVRGLAGGLGGLAGGGLGPSPVRLG